MSYGNRGFIVTAVFGLVVIAFGAGLWFASPPKGHVSRESAQQYQEIERAREEASRAFEKSGDTSKYNPPCHDGQEDRQSDLCAQWRAADAGQSSSRWARRTFFAGFFLGTLTLIAAAFAAYYARLAAMHTEAGAKEGRRTADAAEKQLIHAIEISSIQLRPYIQSGVESFTRDESDPTYFTFSFPFKNVGQTPAQDVVVIETIVFEKFKRPYRLGVKPRKKGIKSDIGMRRAIFGTVARDTEFKVFDIIKLSKTRAADLENLKGILRFYTRITFTDVDRVAWAYEQDFYLDTTALRMGTIHTTRCETYKIGRRADPPNPPHKPSLDSDLDGPPSA